MCSLLAILNTLNTTVAVTCPLKGEDDDWQRGHDPAGDERAGADVLWAANQCHACRLDAWAGGNGHSRDAHTLVSHRRLGGPEARKHHDDPAHQIHQSVQTYKQDGDPASASERVERNRHPGTGD